jgi:peptidoglycan/xylan/chitin deacetylase (PgdA/CDA1 family)
MKRTFAIIAAYVVFFFLLAILTFFLLGNNKLFNITNFFDKYNNVDKSLNNNSKFIILTFDDGWSSQYQAFKMIKPLKGTLYISSSMIGQKDRLTLDNLTEMYNSGWDICNHTVHHTNLVKASLQKANDEIFGCSEWIRGHGFTRRLGYKHFAYPEGAYNENIINILKKQNILTARTTNVGNDTSDFLQLGRTSFSGMALKNIKKVILSDKKLLILNFHRIIPDDSPKVEGIELKESYFKEIINSIHESNRDVITITEWYELNK